MQVITVIPAYGRDYKSKAAMLADFDADMDFEIRDMTSRYDGKPVNKSQLLDAGYDTVQMRYFKQRRAIVHKVKA